MARFKDSTGREWSVSITVGQIERVRAATGTDLNGLLSDGMKGLVELCDDPVRFAKVLYTLCREQAVAGAVSVEAWCDALAGDSLGAAGDAFMEALSDFCPSRQRELLRALMAKAKTRVELGFERAMDAVRNLDPTSFGPATNSPESSASIPAG